jgi:hypothetical protein
MLKIVKTRAENTKNIPPVTAVEPSQATQSEMICCYQRAAGDIF